MRSAESRGRATSASTSSTSTCTRPSRSRTAAAGPAAARSPSASGSSRSCRCRRGGVAAAPSPRLCLHGFVPSARALKREHGVSPLDVAKRLMDYAFHPPTIYFPLIVPEALMIEPTETEPKENLDAFADAMLAIAGEAAEQPELLKEAPHVRPVKRLDEGRAAKRPILRYRFGEEDDPQGSDEPRQLEAQTGA